LSKGLAETGNYDPERNSYHIAWFYGILYSVSTSIGLMMEMKAPSDENTIGLSGLEGSVRQNTSARPSDASLK
jgi:hypothetical protein